MQKSRFGTWWRLMMLGCCLTLVVPMGAGADSDSEKQDFQIKKAEWKAEKNQLKVKGTGKKGHLVDVKDADSLVLLASAKVNSDGKWRVKVKSPDVIPCRVLARLDEASLEKDVKEAPEQCGAPPVEPPVDPPVEPPVDPPVEPPVEPPVGPVTGDFQILAFNDLGMHCYDSDFSVFSILPPFSVVHAQVVRKAVSGQEPEIMDDAMVEVTYSAVADPSGSINKTSIGKTNFWDYVLQIFGISLPEDQGLLGAEMPGSDNVQKPFSEYDSGKGWFTAAGIPLTSYDDQGTFNQYPMMKIEAFDKSTGNRLAYLDVVLPVSDEMNCSECHAKGGVAADQNTAAKRGVSAWSNQSEFEIQYRENVLILHDAVHDTDLFNQKPIVCASCHYSPALDLAGSGPQGDQLGKPFLSYAIHNRHGKTVDGQFADATHPAVIPEDGTTSCYSCHPGSETQCLRGAMGSSGISCQQCHGGLLAVSGEYPLVDNRTRTPWVDEPKCQSCHTGDAVSHQGSDIRGPLVFDPNDPAATPIVATNKRFAEQNNTLFRDSLGHAGIACESCHGSTHAIWPVGDPQANDNITSAQLQGHSGTIIECATCHQDGLKLTMDGPHGMHNVNDPNWNEEHKKFYEKNQQECQACHGLNLQGTVLSKTAADRNLVGKDHRSIQLAKGTAVSCTTCHKYPD